jgi:hypothetical protein
VKRNSLERHYPKKLGDLRFSHGDGYRMPRKDKGSGGDSVGVGLVLGVLLFVAAAFALKGSHRESSAMWGQGRVTAACVGSQLKQIDQTHASLVISYDLQNRTGSDYRLTEDGVVILARLKSDRSLSPARPFHLNYPVFVPPGQHARLALQITQPFAWPAEGDPAYLDRFREFVKGNLENVAEFVVFDQANHSQLELPGPWGGLSDVSPAGF